MSKRYLLTLVFVAALIYVGSSVLDVATSIASAHTTTIQGSR